MCRMYGGGSVVGKHCLFTYLSPLSIIAIHRDMDCILWERNRSNRTCAGMLSSIQRQVQNSCWQARVGERVPRFRPEASSASPFEHAQNGSRKTIAPRVGTGRSLSGMYQVLARWTIYSLTWTFLIATSRSGACQV